MSDIKPPPKPDEPFEKFKRLAGQLLQVPKKELDEKQAEYEREKERKKERREAG